MFGLDNWIAGLSSGTSFAVVLLVAVLLGLRHATDPDHMAAVTTLITSGKERAARSAARLGGLVGAGACADARPLRYPDPRRRPIPSRAGRPGRRDGSRRPHRLPRNPPARALA